MSRSRQARRATALVLLLTGCWDSEYGAQRGPRDPAKGEAAPIDVEAPEDAVGTPVDEATLADLSRGGHVLRCPDGMQGIQTDVSARPGGAVMTFQGGSPAAVEPHVRKIAAQIEDAELKTDEHAVVELHVGTTVTQTPSGYTLEATAAEDVGAGEIGRALRAIDDALKQACVVGGSAPTTPSGTTATPDRTAAPPPAPGGRGQPAPGAPSSP